MQPFIYEATLLKRWVPEHKRFNYFIGISDFHDRKHTANEAQLAHIEQLLDQQDKQTTMIITEDLSTEPNSDAGWFCGQFKINSKGGILGGLTKTCQQKGFKVDNVEYRYCRVAALGPLLTNVREALCECPSACKLLVADMANEVHYAINTLSTHSAALAQAYKKLLKKIPMQLDQLKLTKNSTHSVADYIQENSKDSNRLSLLEELLTFDTDLVDFKLAHSVLTAQNYHKVIAFAGGSHISRVITLLLATGYKQVYKIRSTSRKEHDLSLCIGVPIVNKSYCMKPEPINLEELQRFLLTL